MFAEFKSKHLAHMLWMAERDPEYALWSARQSEKAMPWLLANLERKVAQHVARSRASAPEAGSERGESGPA